MRLWIAVGALAVLGVPAAAQTAPAGQLAAKRFSLSLDNADLRYGLKMLFQAAGVNYTLDQAVQGRVTVSLTDVPFRTALESLLRSAESQLRLTYRVEDGVYFIHPKVEITQAGPAQSEEPPAKPKERVEKIQLNFIDAADVGDWFGGTVLYSRNGGVLGAFIPAGAQLRGTSGRGGSAGNLLGGGNAGSGAPGAGGAGGGIGSSGSGIIVLPPNGRGG